MSESSFTFQTAAATEAWARGLARTLTRPTVVCLSGGLGAGKTQITSWCLTELGVDDAASPTFAIHHRYGTIDHVDLYRVESDADLEGVGFWDLLEGDDRLLFVEWADRLPRTVWPVAWTRIFIEVTAQGTEREVKLLCATPGSTPG